jgi:hypothetical protein
VRFTNHCELICSGLDISELRDWLAAIPFDEWPQQPPLFGERRPAMINDPDWHNLLGKAAVFIGCQLLPIGFFREGEQWRAPMISVLMPGHFITTHTDPQPKDWLYRVHVPISTNPSACLFMDTAYNLKPGSAYKVNVERRHACLNHGDTPRVHFMFDVVTANA